MTEKKLNKFDLNKYESLKEKLRNLENKFKNDPKLKKKMLNDNESELWKTVREINGMKNKMTIEERRLERKKFLDEWEMGKLIKHNENCSQPIQYTSKCIKAHLHNICAEYLGQFCRNCWEHWSCCGCGKREPIKIENDGK